MPILSAPEKAIEYLSKKGDKSFGSSGLKEYLLTLANRDKIVKITQIFPDAYVCPSCFSVNKNVIGNLVLDDFCPVCGQRISN